MESGTTGSSVFEKARDGLVTSLQRHLLSLYEVEKAFHSSLDLTSAFPFAAHTVDAQLLVTYVKHRNRLRDLFIDEVEQLGILAKAVRAKPYGGAEKKQLYLLLLGYMDILWSVAKGLEEYAMLKQAPDDEWEQGKNTFFRLQSLMRLGVKGTAGALI